MTNTFATLIVTAENVERARATAAQFTGGAGMFTTALSANGAEPATHYISSGYMPEEIVQALSGMCSISTKPGEEAMADAGLMMVASAEI